MRVSILRSFWRVHKCRRRIQGCLEPFVERHRRQGYPPTFWDDAAALGFLIALISLLAQRWAGALQADALASLQTALWGRLTGLPRDTLGERVVLLSASADPRFLDGTHRALVFQTALAAVGDAAPAERDFATVGDATALARAAGGETLFGLWDSLLADLPPVGGASGCQEFPDGR